MYAVQMYYHFFLDYETLRVLKSSTHKMIPETGVGESRVRNQKSEMNSEGMEKRL